MATRTTILTGKRKYISDDNSVQVKENEIPDNVGIEMLSEDEGEGEEDGEEDDSEQEEFPELVMKTDSETDGDEDDDKDGDDESDTEGEEREEEEYDSDTSNESLHVFPRAKIVKSDITGQLKKVYPEIEPDYDSDSSTEEVCSN